ncbi:MAG: hypothetical protein H6843_15145 [Rhodospirillaceae bacterium]|nr:hypothetical protein [Rhodospirillaceae bacterium]
MRALWAALVAGLVLVGCAGDPPVPGPVPACQVETDPDGGIGGTGLVDSPDPCSEAGDPAAGPAGVPQP